ncbi:MAG: SUF system Fe-S cluster assembly regulator [Myxococcota bacterium]
MLRISKMTDYAVVLATHLAVSDTPRTVRDLAGESGIPQPTASKVLKLLAKSGVVTSFRGARGGYSLSGRPANIPVLDVVCAIEGPVAVTECSSEEASGSCEYEGSCEVQANWQKINVAIQAALHRITLADMVRAEPSAELVVLSRSRQDALERQQIAVPTARTQEATDNDDHRADQRISG